MARDPEPEEMADEACPCGEPCPPGSPCQECEEYWARMRAKGFWEDGAGWTDKALREWTK
jgi:hypothetical protein